MNNAFRIDIITVWMVTVCYSHFWTTSTFYIQCCNHCVQQVQNFTAPASENIFNYCNCKHVCGFAQCCLMRLWYSEFWQHAVLLSGYWCCGRSWHFHYQSWRLRSKCDADVIGVRMTKMDSILSVMVLIGHVPCNRAWTHPQLRSIQYKLGPNHSNLMIKMTGSSNMLLFTLRLYSVNTQKTSQYNGIFKLVHGIHCARGLHIRWVPHSVSAMDRHIFDIFVKRN